MDGEVCFFASVSGSAAFLLRVQKRERAISFPSWEKKWQKKSTAKGRDTKACPSPCAIPTPCSLDFCAIARRRRG